MKHYMTHGELADRLGEADSIRVAANPSFQFRVIRTQTRRKGAPADSPAAIRVVLESGSGDTFLVFPDDALGYDDAITPYKAWHSPGPDSFSDLVRKLLAQHRLPQGKLEYSDLPVEFAEGDHCWVYGRRQLARSRSKKVIKGGQVLVVFRDWRDGYFIEQVVVRPGMDRSSAVMILSIIFMALLDPAVKNTAVLYCQSEQLAWRRYDEEARAAAMQRYQDKRAREAKAEQNRYEMSRLAALLADRIYDEPRKFTFQERGYSARLAPGSAPAEDRLIITAGQNGSSANVECDEAFSSGLLEAWVASFAV